MTANTPEWKPNHNPLDLSDEFMQRLQDEFFGPVAERRQRDVSPIHPLELKLGKTLLQATETPFPDSHLDVLLYFDVSINGDPAWMASDQAREEFRYETLSTLYRYTESLEKLVQQHGAQFEFEADWSERGVVRLKGATSTLISRLVNYEIVSSLLSCS